MKIASTILAAVLATVVSHAEQPVNPRAGDEAKSSIKECTECAHAPCKCGYSPSYYTHYRKKVVTPKMSPEVEIATKATEAEEKQAEENQAEETASAGPKHPPIVAHWTRPRPQPKREVEVEEEKEEIEKEVLEEYVAQLAAYVAAYEGREVLGIAPNRFLGFRWPRKKPLDTPSLVPSPQRPSAVPSLQTNPLSGLERPNSLVEFPTPPSALPRLDPSVSLGFVPGTIAKNPFDPKKKHYRRGGRSHRDGSDRVGRHGGFNRSGGLNRPSPRSVRPRGVGTRRPGISRSRRR